MPRTDDRTTADRRTEDRGIDALTRRYQANRRVQESRAVRLLATTNLATYLTLMERHLDDGQIAETDLAARLDRDLRRLGTPSTELSGLQLIKLWASQGWLHRVSEQIGGRSRNVCSLTPDARTALDLARRMRREDTVATGGSTAGIAAGLKRVAVQVGADPQQIREELTEQIEILTAQLAELDSGRRPEPNLIDVEDDARTLAMQMEQVITDIGRYSDMLNRVTSRLLDEHGDTDSGYRDRQRRLFDDYDQLFASRERNSYTAFTRMIHDPRQRTRMTGDIATITAALTELDPELRQVMLGFFRRVAQQIDEVGRTDQRCAQRIKRFVAAGTLEHNRGVARQINDALAAAGELLNVSLADSRLDWSVPLARPAITSIGAVTFRIRDAAPPLPAESETTEVDLAGFAAMGTQVDVTALAGLVDAALATGPLSLPDAVGLLDTAYFADLIVLWSWAAAQSEPGRSVPSVPVRFTSTDGVDRRIDLPALSFTRPVADRGEAET